MRVVLCLLALAVSALAAPSPQASCSISGDPHYKTYDNVYHDFMGIGLFVMSTNPWFQVQGILQVCAGSTISCLRDVRVAINNPNRAGDGDIVSWGHWGGVADPLEINRQAVALPGAAGIKTPNQGAVVTSSGNQVTITYTVPLVTASGTLDTWSLTIAPYYLVINIPRTEGFIYSTHGLCGFYNNNPADDFTSQTAVTYLVSAGGQRFNGGAVIPWGASFGVGPTSGNTWIPLGGNFKHTRRTADGKWETFASNTPPPLQIPSALEQTAMDKVNFKSVPAMAAAQARCLSIVTSQAAYENCMYDNGMAGAETIAADLGDSNHQAYLTIQRAQEQAAMADPNRKPDTIISKAGTNAGIACGVIGGIGLIAAMYFFCRRSQVKAEMSRALILRDQKNPGGVQMST